MPPTLAILLHYTNSWQNNCEDLNPTDTLSTVPTLIHASSDHTLNPICAHNPMVWQLSGAINPSSSLC